jgi:hypothetical protein
MTKTKNLCAILAFTLTGMLPATSFAEVIPGTDLSVDFHAGHVVGAGRNINMLRVPVTDINTGKTTLWDASFKFTFLPSQGFVFEEISSAAVSQPVRAITDIATGLYKTQDGYCYLLEGLTILDADRSLYTIRGVSGTGCFRADNFAAQIISGPASGHSDIGARDIVPNLSNTWVYGYLSSRSSTNCCTTLINYRDWELNELIGLRQSGEQLIMGLFSEDGADFKDPKKSAILTRVTE